MATFTAEKQGKFVQNLKKIFDRIDSVLKRLTDLEKKLEAKTATIQEHQSKNEQKNGQQDADIETLKGQSKALGVKVTGLEDGLKTLGSTQTK